MLGTRRPAGRAAQRRARATAPRALQASSKQFRSGGVVQMLWTILALSAAVGCAQESNESTTHTLTGSLVSHYSFDGGTLMDSLGEHAGVAYSNGNETDMLSTTVGRNGDDALEFNADLGDHVTLPSNLTDGVITGKKARSVSMWARIDDWEYSTLF